MGLTEADLEGYRANLAGKAPKRRAPRETGSVYKSKTEALYAARLEAQRVRGEIRRWRYEPMSLVLHPPMAGKGKKRSRYVPDFLVTDNATMATMIFDEIKGAFAREKAIQKLRTAAVLYPEFRFRLCIYAKGVWTVEEVRGQ